MPYLKYGKYRVRPFTNKAKAKKFAKEVKARGYKTKTKKFEKIYLVAGIKPRRKK